MAKILDIKNDVIEIGDSGQLIEARLSDCNFQPRIGDEVEVFKSETGTKVVLSTNSQSGVGQVSENGGININVQNMVPQQPQGYVQSGKVVDKTVYLLLCFFLGSIGVHRFYAGKIGTGILYFFTLGFLGFGVLIDFIIGLCKTSDVNGKIVV